MRTASAAPSGNCGGTLSAVRFAWANGMGSAGIDGKTVRTFQTVQRMQDGMRGMAVQV